MLQLQVVVQLLQCLGWLRVSPIAMQVIRSWPNGVEDLFNRGPLFDPVRDVQPSLRRAIAVPFGSAGKRAKPLAAGIGSGNSISVFQAGSVPIRHHHKAISTEQPAIALRIELAGTTEGGDCRQPKLLNSINT